MDAVRCPECGDVRWSFFGFAPRSTPVQCEVCGGEMVPERRRPRPGARPRAGVERRHYSLPPAPGAPTVPPAL